jgi:DNA polymerase III delta prime subunit
MQLVEKYKPTRLTDFVGLDRPRAILSEFAKAPYAAAFLFVGDSGLGKTTMALALAQALNGEVHHIPSRKCDLQTVDEVVHKCWYVPMNQGFHVVLVDEADQMSRPAQLAFLSKLDTTAAPPKTIFIFTANDTALLEKRFLSRCRKFVFDAQGIDQPIAGLLKRIWAVEASAYPEADFLNIARSAESNIRQAIMDLEIEILAAQAGAAPIPVARPAPATRPRRSIAPIDTSVSAELIDAVELAVALGIHQATVYERVKKGRLPAPSRHGRRMYWQRSEALAC